MVFLIDKVKEQVKRLLFFVKQNFSLFPITALFFHAVTYSLFIYVTHNQFLKGIPMAFYEYPEWYVTFELWLKHFFEWSFATLIFMSSFHRKLNRYALICLFILWVLWFCNTLRIYLNIETQIYFYAWISIIYTTFLYLCIKSLNKRNVKQC